MIFRGVRLGKPVLSDDIGRVSGSRSDPVPFDRATVRLHRERAAGMLAHVRPVLDEVAERLLDRLNDTRRSFTRALDLGGRGAVAPLLAARGLEVVDLDLAHGIVRRVGGCAVVGDEERLPFADASFDLVVANLSLHWVNDLPGALIQLRRALRPDGLLLASIPVLDTLGQLRRGLVSAETALRGGISPRVSPFPRLQDCAGLLQRAGFALPVADLERVSLAYRTPLALLRDLRHAGEANALRERDRRIPPRALFALALAEVEREAMSADGTLAVELSLGMLTGWASA